MASFASFLVGTDYVTAAELEEVTQATVLYGGRLGTALIEAGLMTPAELDQALARHHDLPEIPAEWLKKPDPAARAALHVDLIKRHSAFPLHFEKRTLHVGMLDPRDANVLDALAFASGCLVSPYALSELHFVALMQRVFGVEPTPRFASLLDPGRLARVQRARAAEREAKRRADEQAPQEFLLGPLAADPEDSRSSLFEAVGSHAADPPAAPVEAWEPPAELTLPPAEPPPTLAPSPALRPNAAAQLAHAERALREAGHRDVVIDAALEVAASFAELAALFVVRDGTAAGLRACRAGAALPIETIVAPLASESLLAECVRSARRCRRAPTTALDKIVAKALRCENGSELACFPIAIGGRVVNLLVAEGSGGPLPATAVAALSALVELIGASYERVIRSFKAQPAEGPSG